jgi:hypothetical protein
MGKARVLFDRLEFNSEQHFLEVTRHLPLTDKMVLHFFELLKVSGEVNGDDPLSLSLILFKAEIEKELRIIAK